MITDKFGKKHFKLALHLHTTLSDGRKSPKEVAREYLANGYDAIALTDHWKYGEARTLCGMPIIAGCEYNVGRSETIEGEMHILALFTERDPAPRLEASREEIVEAICSAGGIAVLAHPAWSVNSPEDLARLPKIAATEIYNAVSESHMSMRPYSDYFVDLCANRGMYPGILAADDAHYYDGTDNRLGWVMVEADDTSRESLMNAIRHRRFYATEGPYIHAECDGRRLVIDTSPVSVIATLSNRAWAPKRTLRGENLTHHEYELQSDEKWIRVEVRDKDGRRAWSNIFVI